MNKQLKLYSYEYQTPLNTIPGGVLQCLNDDAYTMLKVNQEFLSMFGFSEKELKEGFQNHFIQMIHPSDRECVMQNTRKQLHNSHKVFFRFRVLCKDGHYKWVMEHGQLIYREDKKQKLFFILHETEAKEEQESFRLSLESHKIIMEQIDDIIFEWNIPDKTIKLSPNWIKKFGYIPHCKDTHCLTSMLRHIHPNDFSIVTALAEHVQNRTDFITAEFRIQNTDGRYIWCRMRATYQYDASGKAFKLLGILSDIDKEKKMIDDLRNRAERDALTGLYNHAETERQISLYIEEKPQEFCALMMIDTDNFKQVNDSMGHLFGDAVLTELATVMKKNTRHSDVVGRIGGDEFTIFLKNIPSRKFVCDKATTLLETFQLLFQGEKQPVEVTCSIGIAIYPDDGKDFHSLYHSADLALYEAKHQGKNQYKIYDASITELPDQIYSSLGAVIDSDKQTMEGMRNLVSYVFQILYDTTDIEHAIQMILEIVGKRFDVSRAYIFENSLDGKSTKKTYEWRNQGISSHKVNLQHFSYEQVKKYEKLFQDNSIFYCRDIHSLQASLLDLFENQGIYSTLQCALRENDAFCGFVEFDECTGKRMWTKEEISMLSLISQLLMTFLQKKRASDRDKQLMVQLNTILDTQDAYIYAIDQNNFELLYLNKKTRELDPNIMLGMTCYQALFEKNTPCNICPLSGRVNEIFNSKYQLWTKIQIAPMKWAERDAYLLSCVDITDYKNV